MAGAGFKGLLWGIQKRDIQKTHKQTEKDNIEVPLITAIAKVYYYIYIYFCLYQIQVMITSPVPIEWVIMRKYTQEDYYTQ